MIITMKVIPSTPSLAFRNLCLLLRVLVNCSNHEYRNLLVYGGKASGDEIFDILTTSLNNSIPWVYFNVDNSVTSIKISGTVRTSTMNLLFLHDLKEINLAKRIKRKAAQTVIISLRDNIPQNLSSIEKTMKILKRCSVPNAALVLWRNSMEIWTANHFLKMYSILIFSAKHLDNFSPPPNLHERVFFSKAKNLHGKKLDVFGYNKPPKMIRIPNYLQKIYPGLVFGGRDGFLANAIAARINARLDYSMTQVHNSTKNLSDAIQFVDSLNHDVFKLHERPDLILMSSYSELHSTDYELLQPHEVDCVAIVIPSIGKPLKIGIGEVLSIPIVKFSPIILLLIVIIWYLILFVNDRKKTDLTKLILDTLGIYLKTRGDCSLKTASEKILLLSLFIFTTIMGGLFTEFVYHNLVKPPFNTNINTLEELTDSGLPIWAEKYVKTILQEFGDTTDEKLLQNIIVKDRPAIIAGIQSKNLSQGYALLHSTIEMYLKNMDMWVLGENVFHELDECLIPIQVAFKIAEHSLLRETINEILLKFLQWGFFQAFRRHEDDLLHRMNISNRIPQPAYEHVAFTLDMNYFVDIFIFLICGLSISFITFLIEISFSYYMTKRREKKRK